MIDKRDLPVYMTYVSHLHEGNINRWILNNSTIVKILLIVLKINLYYVISNQFIVKENNCVFAKDKPGF